MAEAELLNDEWEIISPVKEGEDDWEAISVPKESKNEWEVIKPTPTPVRPRSYGVTGDFGSTFIEKIIDFATAGHITYDPEKLKPRPWEKPTTEAEEAKEIIWNRYKKDKDLKALQQNLARLSEQFPEITEKAPTAKMGFFEEPTGAPLVAAFMGGAGAARAGKGLVGIARRAGREALGWFTGGVSEAPRVAATGLKAAAKGIAAKPLEKTMAKAVTKPIGKEAIEIPTKVAVEVGAKVSPRITKEYIAKRERWVEERMLEGDINSIAAYKEFAVKFPPPWEKIAKKAPVKKDLPKYAQSVNLEKQTLSDSAKRLEVEMAGPKKYQSWDQTEELSETILKNNALTNKVLAKAKKGEGITTVESGAIRQVNVNGIDRLAKLEQEFSAGKMTEEAFQREFQMMRDDIFKVTSDSTSEIARALNYHKKVLSVTESMSKGLAKIEGKMTSRQREAFAEAVKNKDNPVAVSRFLDTIEDPKLVDYVMEFWYNSILSGPPTHVVNIASNTAWSMYQIPHRVHTALWDKIWAGFTGAARTRYINEVIPMMAGYKTGVVKGARSAKDMLRYGQIAEFETKWAQEIGYKAIGAWEKSPNAAIRAAAPFVSAPTRALRAMDVWANSIAYSGEVNSIARRLSTEKGLKGTAREVFETKWKKDLPKWAHEKAMKWAKHNTFMDDPDKFTAAFLKLRETAPFGIGRFVVPFVNTIGNLTKRGLEFTPGVGIAKEVISRQMGRGLGTSEIIAKQIEGAVLSAYIWYKFDQEEITGAAPQSEAERERFYAQGKKAWAVKIGDTWVQYRRIEPANTPIASVAIAREKFRDAKDDATRTEIFGQVARGMVNNWIDSSYFQGVSAVFNRYETGKTFPFRFGASFVPYSSFWRSVNRAYEKATEGEAKVREREGWLPALAQVIPGLSGTVKAELDVWGEEKVIPGSVFQHWLPYKWSEAITWEKDSVEKAIEVLNKPTDISFYPGLPGQRVTIKREKVKLDDDIYRKFCIDYGNKAKTILKAMIEGPLWQRILRNEEEKYYPKLIKKMGSKMDTIRDRARRRAIKEQRIRNAQGE